MKTFQYDTIENKIEFLTTILDVLKSDTAPRSTPWLCLIAQYDLPGCSSQNPNAEYKKIIQNQLIEDGKLTEKQSSEGAGGFDHIGKVTKETYSIRIKYLQDKIAFFQDQLSQQKETKMLEAKKSKRIPIGRKYQKTIDTSGWTNEHFNSLHRGQWVSNFGATGQFLGITARGTITINYKQTRDLKKQYSANAPLRKFVILHGGK